MWKTQHLSIFLGRPCVFHIYAYRKATEHDLTTKPGGMWTCTLQRNEDAGPPGCLTYRSVNPTSCVGARLPREPTIYPDGTTMTILINFVHPLETRKVHPFSSNGRDPSQAIYAYILTKLHIWSYLRSCTYTFYMIIYIYINIYIYILHLRTSWG